MKRDSKVTIRDVAQLAGVSPGTVSKIIHETGSFKDETRQRVLDAIDKLNFQPNIIARSLKTQRTLTLGLVTDDIEGVFTMSMMRGVHGAARANGFDVFLCNSFGDTGSEANELRSLLAKQVDGIILMSGYRVRERGAPLIPLEQTPVVYLYQYTLDMPVPCVIPDDEQGGWLGTQHLINLGHTRIGFINGPSHYEATHHRLAGYRRALESSDLTFEPRLVVSGKWYESSGYRLAHELMTLSKPPTAIFCASDSIAVGVLEALREHGLTVPHDIALVGFDNRSFAADKRPPLTTVALPLCEMGTMAGELLIEAVLNGTPSAGIQRVPCQLVVRESCGTQQA